ncbi:MAG TPA: UDP-glucose 4-epimerase GalE [Chlamydiales bacterium]|nr:UDP-glucose 4-epimerase GalE [Chlamydiales bacterium]
MDAILVTGGAGYIGSQVCKTLAKAGFLPVTYDNLSTGHSYAVKWGPFIEGDLCERDKLHETFVKFQPKAVIHFAASALVVESMADPGKYYRNNLSGSLCLLEAMQTNQVPYLVFSSTCAVYGQPKFVPITEMHPLGPINPYGKSKWMVEQMIADFEAAHGIRSIILRYFNVAGADLQTEIGENHDPETHLIPSVIQAALGVKKEVVVYGTDFPSRDGSAVRDYIHIQDLADAHIAALHSLVQHGISAHINLGTGIGYSVLEIIDAVQKFCNKPIPVRLERSRPGEPSNLTADSAKALKLLEWTPKHSDLSTLIESAWKWHQLLAENASLVKSIVKT